MKSTYLACLSLLVWAAVPAVGQNLDNTNNRDEEVIRTVLQDNGGPTFADWVQKFATDSEALDDNFFQSHLAKLRLLSRSQGSESASSDEALLLQAAATVKDRADVMKALEPYRPYARSGCKLSLAMADGLLSQGKYDEAFKHYQGLASCLYRPDLCYYRMAEIYCLLGDLQRAVKQFQAAKFYEAQLRDSNLP